jgi:hypothetical protein
MAVESGDVLFQKTLRIVLLPDRLEESACQNGEAKDPQLVTTTTNTINSKNLFIINP